MGGRRRHSAQFKAKGALEALGGERTVNEPAGLYQVHPEPDRGVEAAGPAGVAELFGEDRQKLQNSEEDLEAQLYQQIGQLKVEVEFLKKAGLLC